MQNNLVDTYLPDIEGAERFEDLQNTLTRICDRLGFTSFAFTDCNTLFRERPTVVTTAHPDVLAAYEEIRGHQIDPIYGHAMRRPFAFAGNSVFPPIVPDRPASPSYKILEVTRAFGLHEVLCVPFHTKGTSGHPRISIVTLQWPDTQGRFDGHILPQRHELQILLGHWQQKAMVSVAPELFAFGEESPELLTVREREVLCWTARGKTSSETGDILRVSSQTVDFHLRNACRKLGASNRTNAVALALIRGLIFL